MLDAIKAQGLYKAPISKEKHDITCPWVTSHTNSVDHGTAYFEPSEAHSRGGFKCMHGSCTDKHLRHLLKQLGIDPNDALMKATITCEPGSIARTVDAAERVLAGTGRHFQRAGSIVVINRDPASHEEIITPLSVGATTLDLANEANWLRYDGRKEAYVPCDPPARHMSALIDRDSYRHLPVLNGLARQPFLRSDGSLCKIIGYDKASGIFGTFGEDEFVIGESPSRIQALHALDIIAGLLEEFPFASNGDKSAALAAILTATIRPSLDHAPMFHVRSHSVGSGKSYLCSAITAFATDRKGSPMAFPNDDDECRKLLLAELMRGPAVIEFDNMTTDIIPHKSLCTALTSESLSGRILGVSKTASVSTKSLFLSSGNNVSPVRDMTRRCITINLNPMVETPATRTFKRPELHREIQKNRALYVAAGLKIILAFIEAGKPMTTCKALAGFGNWSDLCRQSLLWLGLADPATSIFEAMAEDPDRELLDRLLAVWHRHFPTTAAMVRNLMIRVPNDKDLEEVLRDIAEERGEINRRRLGWWLKRHEGRVVNGLRLLKDSGSGNASAWRVEAVI